MFFTNRKIETLRQQIAALEAQLAECRETLGFYADESNWREGMRYRDADDATVLTDSTVSAIAHDKGRRARAVLQDDRTGVFDATRFYDKTEFKA